MAIIKRLYCSKGQHSLIVVHNNVLLLNILVASVAWMATVWQLPKVPLSWCREISKIWIPNRMIRCVECSQVQKPFISVMISFLFGRHRTSRNPTLRTNRNSRTVCSSMFVDLILRSPSFEKLSFCPAKTVPWLIRWMSPFIPLTRLPLSLW